MIDVDYEHDIELLTNKPPQTESILISIKQAAEGCDLYGNANKMRFK